jgi:hypothetical protein
VAESLDANCWELILEAAAIGIVHHQQVKNMADALGGATRRHAIYRLLETGALRTKIGILKPTQEMLAKEEDMLFEDLMAYHVTELGRAVAQYGIRELGLGSPEVQHI